MTAIPLKPCPFCGGEADITQYGSRRYSTIYECLDCGCKLETPEEGNYGAMWNRRAEPERKVEFTELELNLLLLGMTTAGLVGNGGEPAHQTMEALLLHRNRMLELTHKLDAMLTAAPKEQSDE